jgi:hypothetical protein
MNNNKSAISDPYIVENSRLPPPAGPSTNAEISYL